MRMQAYTYEHYTFIQTRWLYNWQQPLHRLLNFSSFTFQ